MPPKQAILAPMRHPPEDSASPVTAFLQGYSGHARRSMHTALAMLADIATEGRASPEATPWHQLRYTHTRMVRNRLVELHEPATVNHRLSALRGILKTCWRMGLIRDADYYRAIDIEATKGSRNISGREIDNDEIRELFRACDDETPGGIRDAAMIGCLYGCGLRRSEAVGLDLLDVNLRTGKVTIIGKGNKERELYLPDGSMEALRRWLDLRGSNEGPLFYRIRKGGKLVPSRLSDQAVLTILAKRGKLAGLRDFSAHDFRRSFISHLLDNGVDLVTVQKLAGHEDPKTTSRYDRRGDESKKKAALKLDVPV